MKLCDLCQINPAILKITQIVGNEKTDLNLCKKCAEEKGLGNPLSGIPSNFGAVLIGLISQGMPERTRTVSSVTCDRCGTNKTDFESKGLLGCGNCYETFVDDLKFILRRIHGSNKHIGHRPSTRRKVKKLPDINLLRRQLQSAIDDENFEEAARLRDLVRDYEAQLRRNSVENAEKKSK